MRLKILSHLKAIIAAAMMFFCVTPLSYFDKSISNNFSSFHLVILSILYFSFFKIDFRRIGGVIALLLGSILLLSFNNLQNLSNSISSAAFLSIGFIGLCSSSSVLRVGKPNLILLFNWFIVIFTAFSIYQNIFHLTNLGITVRSKGFGSGTVYSIIASICILYVVITWKKWQMIPIIIINLSSMLLTQSRGPVIVLLLVFILLFKNSFRKIAILFFFIWITIEIVGSYDIYFIQRFSSNEFNDMNEFSSGRYESQTYFTDEIVNDFDMRSIFFGKGVGSISNVANKLDISFPHLDFVTIFYEGGLVLFVCFLLLIFKWYKTALIKPIVLLYVLNALHTNMLFFIGLPLLLLLLENAVVIKRSIDLQKNTI